MASIGVFDNIRQPWMAAPEIQAKSDMIVAQYDQNADGALDIKTEAQAGRDFFSKLVFNERSKLGPRDITAMLKAADRLGDVDGKVTAEELSQLMSLYDKGSTNVYGERHGGNDGVLNALEAAAFMQDFRPGSDSSDARVEAILTDRIWGPADPEFTPDPEFLPEPEPPMDRGYPRFPGEPRMPWPRDIRPLPPEMEPMPRPRDIRTLPGRPDIRRDNPALLEDWSWMGKLTESDRVVHKLPGDTVKRS